MRINAVILSTNSGVCTMTSRTGFGRYFACSDLVVVGHVGLLLVAFVQSAQSAEGSNPFDIFIQSYIDEWGKPPKSDPTAPPSRWPTSLLPPQPETTPRPIHSRSGRLAAPARLARRCPIPRAGR